MASPFAKPKSTRQIKREQERKHHREFIKNNKPMHWLDLENLVCDIETALTINIGTPVVFFTQDAVWPFVPLSHVEPTKSGLEVAKADMETFKALIAELRGNYKGFPLQKKIDASDAGFFNDVFMKATQLLERVSTVTETNTKYLMGVMSVTESAILEAQAKLEKSKKIIRNDEGKVIEIDGVAIDPETNLPSDPNVLAEYNRHIEAASEEQANAAAESVAPEAAATDAGVQ